MKRKNLPAKKQATLPTRKIVEEINQLHNDLDQLQTTLKIVIHTSGEKLIRMGELLTQVKEEQQHGAWLAWLRDNIDFSDQTARNYMRAFENQIQNPDIIKTVLNLKELYSNPDKPEVPPLSDNAIDLMAAAENLPRDGGPLFGIVSDPDKGGIVLVYFQKKYEKITYMIFEIPKSEDLFNGTLPKRAEFKEVSGFIKELETQPELSKLRIKWRSLS